MLELPALLQLLFLLALLALLVPALVLVVALGTALPAFHRTPAPTSRRPSLAVLVPAHDEADGIGATLASIGAQMQEGDTLLVIADNCDDGTADVARAAGALVAERHDQTRRGKGYALDFGVRHLAQSASAAPEVLVVIDADCLLHPGVLDRLARTCLQLQRPVQARYLMHAREGASPMTRVAEFAWTVKNWLRPLGYHRLGLPCQLMGTGMAFPWQLISALPLASGHIVEDLQLGLDCAALGKAAIFCPDAIVDSMFPDNAQGAQAQRTRWEHGHLTVLAGQGPALLIRSVARRDLPLFALALDLCVPPLSLLLLLATGAAAAGAALWTLSGHALPWVFAFAPLAIVAGTVLAAWFKEGRRRLPFMRIVYVALYLVLKIPLYIKFLVRRQRVWISSLRDKP